MELKIKSLNWATGFPVAMLNKKTADKIGVQANDRISIRTISSRPREISVIVDIVKGLIKESHASLVEAVKVLKGLGKIEKPENADDQAENSSDDNSAQ